MPHLPTQGYIEYPPPGHEDWQNWDFPRLIKALKTWKEINPVESNDENSGKPGAKFRGRESTFQTKETMPTQRACVL